MNKLNGESMDLTRNNLNELQNVFPEVFTDGKVDFDKLKLILGEDIETSDEKYELRWKGKNEAIKIAQTPSMGTLRPDRESSKNWDGTENLYIEGDNLEVLKLLQKSYFGKIKMIYIDPPYNTGKDFVYKDNFRDNISNYKEITNQKNQANKETNGRYHTDWLNMMYPRLKLARNLLKEDGVIFISIDDNEVSNLKKICEELFGDDNVEQLIWQKTDSRVDKNTNSKQINRVKGIHEYLIVCYKNKLETFFKKMMKLPDWKKECKNIDNDPRGPWQSGIISYAEGHKNEEKDSVYYYSITTPSGVIYTRHWFVTEDKFKKLDLDNRISYPKDGDGVPRLKTFENEEKEYYMESILRGVGTSSTAKDELMMMLGNRDIFETPKPVKLLMELIRISTKKDDIILDFFGGSCSTANALMRINKECNSARKFIMVQLPQQTDEKSEAYKAGYKNICEIGKERINRAGEQIISEAENYDLDIGFKVFKLDDSNIKAWDSNYDNLETTLFDMVDNIKEDRSQEDLLYEILLKLGYPLTSKIEEININDKTIFNIENSLLVCLENEIDSSIIEVISQINIKDKDTLKVVFKDSGFKSDKDKMNAVENFNQFNIKNINFI